MSDIPIYLIEITKEDGQLKYSGIEDGKMNEDFAKKFHLDAVSIVWRQDLDQKRVHIFSQNKEAIRHFSSGMGIQLDLQNNWDKMFSKAQILRFNEKAQESGDWFPKQVGQGMNEEDFKWENKNDNDNQPVR